ncbi:hypothetical protein CONPUDRAFT_135973 [Coniophora puteana RWD-64-598 SS2]|uniref:Zn(2)-C6 fungal-type domain-containing protein n=1 Tax=Coniophora puteana (strain RWD-64-598) TaxID=741705 RepID=A0A5M3MV94_CONPW|nr:uncharacterized protein CONPUDRAFT_135973 [Coniophora puteana RWD-64-598 SS2]EIW82635.1 hypothetical protein CONPUDRAFT_135973 [Coniophora puteana RWD-64-598 SS2]
MDGFQFIIESPQENQGHKKRPRLVTSCDNCRLKKIKCIQPSPETECEACKSSKVPCKFRDRERYFAERSRAIAGPSASGAASSQGSRKSSPTSHVESPAGPGPERRHSRPSSTYGSPHPYHPASRASSHSPPMAVYSSENYPRYQSYSPDQSRSSGSSGPYPRSSPPRPVTGSVSPFFDPSQHQAPHRNLLPLFVDVFFRNMSQQCPFITLDEVQERIRHHSLSPLLANALAAVSARLLDPADLQARGLYTAPEVYGDTAKNLLSSVLQQPALDTLHAMILIAWAEYKGGNTSSFRQYSDLAMRMALALGLSEDAVLGLSPYVPYQNRLRLTWSSVMQIQMYSSSIGA